MTATATTTPATQAPAPDLVAPDTDGATTVPIHPTTAGRRSAFALGLWLVVGGLLAYGVMQTVLKASALFG